MSHLDLDALWTRQGDAGGPPTATEAQPQTVHLAVAGLRIVGIVVGEHLGRAFDELGRQP